MNFSLLAEEDTSKHWDMAARMLLGPWDRPEPPYEPNHAEDWIQDTLRAGVNEKGGVGDVGSMLTDRTNNILTRYRERTELDKRAAEYLNLVEAQTAGTSSFTAPAAATLAAAAPARVCHRRH